MSQFRVGCHVTWRVTDVTERFRQEHVAGAGSDEKTLRVSTGWWITMVNEHGSLVMGIGPERYGVQVGDNVSGTLRIVS